MSIIPAKMSITIDGEWTEPASSKKEDIEAAERRNHFEVINIRFQFIKPLQ